MKVLLGLLLPLMLSSFTSAQQNCDDSGQSLRDSIQTDWREIYSHSDHVYRALKPCLASTQEAIGCCFSPTPDACDYSEPLKPPLGSDSNGIPSQGANLAAEITHEANRLSIKTGVCTRYLKRMDKYCQESSSLEGLTDPDDIQFVRERLTKLKTNWTAVRDRQQCYDQAWVGKMNEARASAASANSAGNTENRFTVQCAKIRLHDDADNWNQCFLVDNSERGSSVLGKDEVKDLPVTPVRINNNCSGYMNGSRVDTDAHCLTDTNGSVAAKYVDRNGQVVRQTMQAEDVYFDNGQRRGEGRSARDMASLQGNGASNGSGIPKLVYDQLIDSGCDQQVNNGVKELHCAMDGIRQINAVQVTQYGFPATVYNGQANQPDDSQTVFASTGRAYLDPNTLEYMVTAPSTSGSSGSAVVAKQVVVDGVNYGPVVLGNHTFGDGNNTTWNTLGRTPIADLYGAQLYPRSPVTNQELLNGYQTVGTMRR